MGEEEKKTVSSMDDKGTAAPDAKAAEPTTTPAAVRPTFDEALKANKDYQAEFDRRVAKAIETAKEKWETREQEAIKNAREKAVRETAEEYAGKAADYEKRLMTAKIENAVIKAKPKDAGDVIKILDLSKIKAKEDGSLEGLDDQLKALKEAKAYLFEDEEPSGSTGLEHGAKAEDSEDATIRRNLGLI